LWKSILPTWGATREPMAVPIVVQRQEHPSTTGHNFFVCKSAD
jgi:hypothetical protein